MLACTLAGAALARSDVAEVEPAALRASLRTPGLAVVLFTSSDPKCGFCRGQSGVLDNFAAGHHGQPRLVRVQWTPWRNFPPAELLPRRVLGIPTWIAFRDGEAVAEHTGQMDAASLRQFVDDVLQGRAPKPAPDVDAAAPAPAPRRAVRQPPPDDAPLTPQEREALAVMARWLLLDEGLQQCARQQAAEADRHEAARRHYAVAHEAALELGAKLMLTRRGGNSVRESDAIFAAETAGLEREIPKTATLADGCQRMNDIARR